MPELLLQAALIAFGVVLSVIGTLIVYYVKKRALCAEVQAQHLDKLDKRTFRQSQAMEQMAAQQDKVTNKYHPDAQSNLAETVGRILRDEKGDL